ncbi:phospholipase D-like domain-containing protein [Herbaspirillum sp. 1130]|uniref:phospholipase D-like domain-containing protein n=1 Tax=Herbaspirillum sp. 1130 TaxID=2806562 RepID=UPI001B4C14DB|nr:phospholipase D-like domain-containing protein [Herbaspirillum sp. 1130]MBP1314575.1 phosphatidylserine/phosphatidylglycerophosphate/cardiolipin synthase-like enzyme [Herbaspirillum sp. 1130]
MKASAGKAAHRAQIVRTQPEEGDNTIQRLYRQATSFASNYIYIENQYFQYTEWARYLKQMRRNFIAAWKEAGQPLKTLPDLHVFIVIPTPERVQMVPATHEALKLLGLGTSMPEQDKMFEEQQQVRQKQQQREIERVRFKETGNGTPPELVRTPKPPPGQQEPYGNAEIAEELEALGIKTLAASLWTYDHTAKSTGDKYREIYIHSKLMIIDDAFFTLGSANLNLRSMAVDAEINIGCDDPLLSEKLRKEVLSLHSFSRTACDGGNGSPLDIKRTFLQWQRQLLDKACCARFPFLHANCLPLACFLHPLPVSGTDELIRPILWPRSSTSGTARPMSKKGSPSPIRVIAGWTSLRKKLNGNGWIRPTNPCLQDAKPSRSAISVRKNQWQKEADRRVPHLAPKKNAG